MLGRYEQALEAIREQQRRYPEWTGPFIAETRALYALGRYEEARQVARERLSDGWGIIYLVGIHTALGDTAAAREVATEIEEAGAPPIIMAYVHAGFGDVDATLAAFEAVDEWGYVPTATLRYPTFPEGMDRIRTRPRYETLLRRVNEAWGLKPDGSLPDSVGVSFDGRADG